MAHPGTMDNADILATNPVTAVEEDADHTTMRISAEAVVVEPTAISHITVEHTECVPIQENIAIPQRMSTRRMNYGVIICWAVRETAPERLGP